MENLSRNAPVASNSEVLDFTDLNAWKAARALRKNIYMVCRGFPKQETFELSSQMRRAVVSMTANLAEGYGRFSYQENMQKAWVQSMKSGIILRRHSMPAISLQSNTNNLIFRRSLLSSSSTVTSGRQGKESFKLTHGNSLGLIFPKLISIFDFPLQPTQSLALDHFAPRAKTHCNPRRVRTGSPFSENRCAAKP